MADEDSRLDSRVAKIESHVAHLDSTLAVVQIDLRALRRETGDGLATLEAKLDGKIETLRKETADGFREVRKSLRTDLGLFFAGFSLLVGIAALIFKG